MKLNFLMDKDTELRFFEFLSGLECEFLVMKSLKIYSSTSAYDFADENGYIFSYIYHPFFGELDIYSDESGFMAFSEINSPVISFNNSPIFTKQKLIKAGKISVRLSYLMDCDIIKKPRPLSEFYKKISFWLNTNLTLRSIKTQDASFDMMMSRSIYDMFLSDKLKNII